MGADIFAQNCARCHGPEGQGTQRAPSLNVKSYLADVNDAALEQIVTFGVPGTAMPTWGDRLSEVEIQAVVGFMRSWEPTAPEVAVPARSGGGPWWSTSGSQPGQQALPSGGQQRGNKGKGKAANGRSASAQNDGLNQPGLATQTPTAAATRSGRSFANACRYQPPAELYCPRKRPITSRRIPPYRQHSRYQRSKTRLRIPFRALAAIPLGVAGRLGRCRLPRKKEDFLLIYFMTIGAQSD